MSKTVSTDKCIQSAKPGTSRKELPVYEAPGLYLVVQPSGAKSFAIRYRHDGRNTKMTLGSYPLISLKVARDEARRIKDLITNGIDPMASTVTLDDYTFEAVFKDFMTRHCEVRNSAATIKATRSMVNTSVMPFWKDKDIRNLTKRDVIVLTDRIVDRGRLVQANRVLVMIKTFFKWCIDRDYLETSPAESVQKPSMETSRDRVLLEHELNLIWRAADRIGFPYGTIAKALILSGQRKMEVGGASYAEFTTDKHGPGPCWLIPKERCKNKRDQLLSLPPLLASVLNSAPRIAGSCDFIFTNDGDRMVNAYGDGKKLIDAAMVAIQREDALKAGGDPDAIEVTPHWTFHDMRRTVASGLGALQVDPHVIEAVLNHASGIISGTAATYNRYSYLAEKRAALMKWETTIRRVCLGETNVMPLFQQAAG